jgi:hypothetical protein
MVVNFVTYVEHLRNYTNIYSYFYIKMSLFNENGEQVMHSEKLTKP